MKNYNNKYIFVLGREQKIALFELSSVLRRFGFFVEPTCDTADAGQTGDVYFGEGYISSLSDNCIIFNTERSDAEIAGLIKVLGGTTKIFKIMGDEKRLTESAMLKYFTVKPGKRLTFGISGFSKKIPTNTLNMLGLELKKIFKKSGSARFVALRGENELSTVVSYGQKLDRDGIELGIFFDEMSRKYTIGKLIAVTNPSEWSHRDFDKPKSDKFSGMVPPKLARMMVNIALGSSKIQDTRDKQITNSNTQTPNDVIASKAKQSNNLISSKVTLGAIQQFSNDGQKPTVFDPFCGSGNILMEAMMLGCNVIGSDISEKAVNDTKINLAWLTDESYNSKVKSQNFNSKVENVDGGVIPIFSKMTLGANVEGSLYNKEIATPQTKLVARNDSENLEPEIFQADATTYDFSQLSKLLPSAFYPLTIVGEPYLGEPKKFKPTLNAARGEYSKVKEIYLGFLKNLSALPLTPDSLPVCLVFPAVDTVEGKIYSLFNDTVDEIQDLGYTLESKPLLYGRDYQVVKRQIVVLKLQETRNKKQTNLK